jgi:hypothetical protein
MIHRHHSLVNKESNRELDGLPSWAHPQLGDDIQMAALQAEIKNVDAPLERVRARRDVTRQAAMGQVSPDIGAIYGRDLQFYAMQESIRTASLGFEQHNEMNSSQRTTSRVLSQAQVGVLGRNPDPNLINIVNGLDSLQKLTESEEFDPPTEHAVLLCFNILMRAWISDPNHFPTPAITTDGDGGATVSWCNGDRELTLEIPPDSSRSPYIYWRTGGDYGVEDDVTHVRLNSRLAWLLS